MDRKKGTVRGDDESGQSSGLIGVEAREWGTEEKSCDVSRIESRCELRACTLSPPSRECGSSFVLCAPSFFQSAHSRSRTSRRQSGDPNESAFSLKNLSYNDLREPAQAQGPRREQSLSIVSRPSFKNDTFLIAGDRVPHSSPSHFPFFF